MRLSRILNAQHVNARARNLAVWRYIIEVEIAAGTSFMAGSDGNYYIYLGVTSEILLLPTLNRGGERVAAYLNALYGITQTDMIGKFVYSALRDYAISNAAKADLRRFASYNTTSHTCYLSGYNGQMWRIDGGTPEKVNNGEDDVFFADDDGGVTVEPDFGPHGILLDKLTSLNFTPGLGGITPEQQRMALTVWIFMLAFPDLMPTKPLLILEGTQGAGKSASVQLLQLALLGISKPMILSKNKEDDFGVLLLRSPIAVFDNTDSFIEWVPDAICAYTTLGYWVKRKLFSDASEVQIRPHAFIAVASKNPASFRREDVADRCVILRLERRLQFKKFAKLQKDILEARAQLLGEYMWYVNEIINYLRITNADEAPEETTRMADFAAFARAVGDVMHWAPSDVAALMDALGSERDAFINEEDSLVELLHKWIVYRGGGFTNIGRERSLFELHAELESMAQAHSLPYYKSARTLAQKIRSPHVARDFDVTLDVTGGKKIYRIWRKTDPRLGVVAGDGEADEGIRFS
jgi:hypothetical protein